MLHSIARMQDRQALRERLLAGPDRVVIALCADWCHVCRGFEPVLEGVARELATIAFGWIDIEDEYDLVAGIDVDDFPTLVVFEAGRLVHAAPVRAQAEAVARLLERLRGAPAIEAPAAALLERLARSRAAEK